MKIALFRLHHYNPQNKISAIFYGENTKCLGENQALNFRNCNLRVVVNECGKMQKK